MIWIERRTIGLLLMAISMLFAVSFVTIHANESFENAEANQITEAEKSTSSQATSTVSASKPAETKLTNSIGMKLVLISAGKFLMGSPDSQAEHLKSEQQHQVHISKPFYMGQFEVTQSEYEKVTQTNPSFHKKREADLEKYPVERVSWFDAVAFCEKLSEMPAEKKLNRKYRLPTEAEWEYACRAGTDTPFHFGNSLNGEDANVLGLEPFGTETNGPNLGATSPVGSYKPNAFGLYDMHGNVWEWCSDWYTPDYYAESPKNDPQGPPNGVGKIPFRTVRSGGWKYKAAWATSAHRGDHNPKDRKNPSFGMRVVCEILTNAEVAVIKTKSTRTASAKTEATKIDLSIIKVETNSIGMKFVSIPAGKFQMGSPPNEKERQDIEVLHEVAISKPFLMGQYEVTQAEYEKLTGAKPSYFNEERVKEKTDDFPVEQVSWSEAVEYCKKLSDLPDEKKAGRKYRLPTEAEWEYACRAGKKTVFYHGDSVNGTEANCNGKKPYNSDVNGPNLKRTCAVGKYPPNPFGLYDMHGNVWEWCSDWFDPAYYKNSPAVDPKGPTQGLTNYYVDVQPNPKAAKKGAPKTLRGGSWSNYGGMVRAAFRDEHPEDHFNSIGFRVLCEKSRD